MSWTPVSARFANNPSATTVTITSSGSWQPGDILYLVLRGWFTFAEPRGFLASPGSNPNVPDNTGWRNANPASSPPQSGYLGVGYGGSSHLGIAWVGCRVYAGEASFTVGYDQYSSAGPLLAGIVAFRSSTADPLLTNIPSDITRGNDSGTAGVLAWDDSNNGASDPDTHYWINSLWGPPTDLTEALGVQAFLLDVTNTNTGFGFATSYTETTVIDSSGMITGMGGARDDYGDDPHPYVCSITFGYRLYNMPDFVNPGDGAPASSVETFGFPGQLWEGAGWTTILANGTPLQDILSTVATIDHDLLIGVEEDQHHPKAHAIIDENHHSGGFIYKSGWHPQITDTDVTAAGILVPADGQVAVTYDTQTGQTMLWTRINGVWAATEVNS